MAGLLDLIGDPEFMEVIAERCALVDRLARSFGTTPKLARDWLDAQDATALETFREGNSYPRDGLH
jgi:hypothetical protein